ncbi:hypothetical protein GQ55_4G195700 [Panicum hallii var. hallii]|uniref:Uncharacterized protein n=1 Tax=Panicum hallii var. hallii TaxID=1504633 RepID=A0A2T7DZ24_9POAL|nr:hypothetical protein GQ55_4G195700 [Panicum hallii var. hallii]
MLRRWKLQPYSSTPNPFGPLQATAAATFPISWCGEVMRSDRSRLKIGGGSYPSCGR